MNLYFVLNSEYRPYFDPIAPFQTKADKDILEKFKSGYRLVNWNWTCPVNWYLESRDKQHQILLSGKDYNREASKQSHNLVPDLVRIGVSAGKSDGIVPSSWAHRDGGKPGKEWFEFSLEKFEEEQERFKLFQSIEKEWNTNPIPLDYKPEQLSEIALALLRFMKAKNFYRLWPFDELHATLNELRLQGLLALNSDSTVELTPAALRLRVPKGPTLKLLRKPTTRQLKTAQRWGRIISAE